MEIVSLVDFVKSGEVFEKIEGYYDQIVSDFDFGSLKGFVKIDTFLDFNKVDKAKTTLFILDKLLYENIDKFLDMDKFCVLDMNFGMNSLNNKLSVSNIDLNQFVDKSINVYEPLDMISFIYYLESKGKNYIRINNYNLPLNFSDNSEVKDFMDLDNKGFDGDSFTLITSGAMLPEIIRTAHLLNDNGLFVSIIVLNKLNTSLYDLNLNSKNIIFVFDFFEDNNYQKTIKDKLKGFNIRFIYPNYSNITTVLDEYRYQDFMFDAESIFNLIKKCK